MAHHLAYCVKCKAQTDVKTAQRVVLANGSTAMKGKCRRCASEVYKIIGKQNVNFGSTAFMRFAIGAALSFTLVMGYFAITKHHVNFSHNGSSLTLGR